MKISRENKAASRNGYRKVTDLVTMFFEQLILQPSRSHIYEQLHNISFAQRKFAAVKIHHNSPPAKEFHIIFNKSLNRNFIWTCLSTLLRTVAPFFSVSANHLPYHLHI